MFAPTSKSAAILVAEVADYERLAANERATAESPLQQLHHEVVDRAIAMHGGRTFELEPDHSRVEFVTALDAVRCARQIEDGLAAGNAELPPDRRLALRIGIHYGEVTVDGADLFGPGLDIALRVTALSEPGEICVSRTVRERVERRLDLSFEDLAGFKGRYVPQAGLAYRVRPVAGTARDPGRVGWPAPLRLGVAVALVAAIAWLALAGTGAPLP